MKVGMVARCLNTAHIRGMGKYVQELLGQSLAHGDIEWRLFGDDPRYPMAAPSDARIRSDIFTFRGDRFQFWEQLGLPLRVASSDLDLVHCTEGSLPLWQTKPMVVTVHDTLLWEEPGEDRVTRFYVERLLPAAMRRCAAVITISQSSRDDILARWPWLEPKLSVIPHGISDEYFNDDDVDLPPDIAAFLGTASYLVYLGGPMERKRFTWAAEVLARCADRNLKLVACGFGEAARLSAQAGLPNELRDRVHFARFLSDGELRSVYRSARAVLYPTLYEGFGFPAIEAQTAGVPVLFSALGSLKELIGPLAVVVPPEDMAAWVAAVDQARADAEHHATRVKSARDWARSFRWSESYDKHRIVYRSVAAAAGRID